MTIKTSKSISVGVIGLGLCAIAWQSAASAQENPRPEPEYLSTVYWYDAAANKLNPLQRQALKMDMKPKALGLGGMKNVLQADGARSDVRFTAQQKLEFVLQAPPSVDPQTIVEIVKFTEAKGHRELIVSQLKTFSFHPMDLNSGDKAKVSFEVKRYSASSIEITSSGPLEPGEYAVRTPPGGQTAFCFGIDPQAAK